MIHQELSVFPELTIAEHLELDRLPRWIRWDELHQRTQNFLDQLQIGLKTTTRVKNLSVGGRQLVEIARALYRNARVLVFDEPTSALTEQEVLRLYDIIDHLRKEGKAIIYITHRMDEVFRLADRIIVLRDGHNVGELSTFENGIPRLRSDLEPKIITWMVGRAIQDIYPKKNTEIGTELLRVENLTLCSPQGKILVKEMRFTLRAGEIVGLAGLLGAGRSEIFEALFGIFNPKGPRGTGYEVSGNVWIKNQRLKINAPNEAIKARIGFVSEDRKATGLVLNQSISKNMSLPALASGRSKISPGQWLVSWVDRGLESTSSQRWTQELRIRSASIDQPVSELSGGNQQKVVFSKWLLTEPEILFLDEPTRGIDVGAKVEIYQWIQRLAGQGIGILLASSEMPELLGLCHRLIVLREGHLSAEFSKENATQEEIMRAASL